MAQMITNSSQIITTIKITIKTYNINKKIFNKEIMFNQI